MNYQDAAEIRTRINLTSKEIEYSPKNVKLYRQRAKDYEKLEKYDEAISDYDIAIQLEPDNKYGYIYRAYCFERLELFENALNDYKEALYIDPEDTKVYNLKIDCLLRLNEYSKAISDLNVIIDLLGTKNPNIYKLRAECYEKTEEYDRAIKDYNNAIKLCDVAIYQDLMVFCKGRIRQLEILVNPIRLSDCSEEEISTLKVFDDIRVKQFIQARKEGKTWYNMDSFAEYFNLQPHEITHVPCRWATENDY